MPGGLQCSIHWFPPPVTYDPGNDEGLRKLEDDLLKGKGPKMVGATVSDSSIVFCNF